MSKTLRKTIRYSWQRADEIICDDRTNKNQGRKEWNKPKKLKPYMRGDVPYKGKFRRKQIGKYRNTQGAEGIRNANRGLKKAYRQQLKKELTKLNK